MFIEIVHQNLSLVMNEIRYGCSVKSLDTYFTLQLKFLIFECKNNQNTSPLSSCFVLFCLVLFVPQQTELPWFELLYIDTVFQSGLFYL